MDSVGARLKKIRLEEGLTLEDVHKKTKLHLNIIKAIEEDTLSQSSPVYTKSFLKLYCKALGVDPSEYIAGYQEPQSRIYFSRKAERQTKTITPPDFKKTFSYLSKINFRILFIGAVAVLVILGLFKITKAVFSKKPKTQAAETVKEKPRAVSVSTARPKEAAEARSVTPPAPVPPAIKLGIRAKDNCYISLKTDGHTAFQGTLKKGFSDNWQARERIEFSLNNAGAVEFQINGKSITTLGRKGQSIKGIITEQRGLEILR